MYAAGTNDAPGNGVSLTTDDRRRLAAQIDAVIRSMPEDEDKGKLRGLLLRLRDSCTDGRRFEDELHKLAALSGTVARRQPAVRLHELLTAPRSG